MLQLGHTLENLRLSAEKKDKRNSVLIMLTTSIVLITLLVRSCISKEQAFNSFVMFFYRCQREYQHIYERKQGFSEFKYLTNITTERVDALPQTGATTDIRYERPTIPPSQE
jgi:hypothetical protein